MLWPINFAETFDTIILTTCPSLLHERVEKQDLDNPTLDKLTDINPRSQNTAYWRIQAS